jgi:hypothetical protein
MDDDPGRSPVVDPGRRPRTLRRLLASAGVREAALYAAAAVSYVVVGVFVTQIFLFWPFGFAWLLLSVWALPALIRRMRR